MPTDKTLLDDNRLDLSADHVHTLELPISVINDYMAGNITMEEVDGFDSLLEEVQNFTGMEGRDAVIVITVKAGQ